VFILRPVPITLGECGSDLPGGLKNVQPVSNDELVESSEPAPPLPPERVGPGIPTEGRSQAREPYMYPELNSSAPAFTAPAPVTANPPSAVELGAPTVVPALAKGPPNDRHVQPVSHVGPIYHPNREKIVPSVPGAPREFEKKSLPEYVVEPPDILRIQATDAITGADRLLQPLRGEFLVRPDGTVNMGIYGQVYVAGYTLNMVKDVVADTLFERLPERLKKKYTDDTGKVREAITKEGVKSELDVDVIGYNSKFYYIITDGGGYGQAVYRIPSTGNETVLDALGQINGLPVVASKKHIWVARATLHDVDHPMIMPVDWKGISELGSARTNYQIFPGDRIFVQSDALIRADSFLAKLLSPYERIVGATLLTSTTLNSFKVK